MLLVAYPRCHFFLHGSPEKKHLVTISNLGFGFLDHIELASLGVTVEGRDKITHDLMIGAYIIQKRAYIF